MAGFLRRLFRPARSPLRGAPAARREKNYSAQSGYVYRYFYLGYRPLEGEQGSEYVFQVSGGREPFAPVSVLLSAGAVAAWEEGHGRALSATERYAVAKTALFQAFDERAAPAAMRQPVRVRAADAAEFLERLGLD